jgi:hypothetical protein
MTLLERANEALKEHRFEDWYNSLSQDEIEQFSREIQEAERTFVAKFNRLLEQLPSAIEYACESFTVALGNVIRSAQQAHQPDLATDAIVSSGSEPENKP